MTPSGRVANKVALVTGAASGIGRATALLLAKQRAAVVVTDLATETGQKVVEEISRNGRKAVFLALDVTEEAAWQDVTDRILHYFAKLDWAGLVRLVELVQDRLDCCLAANYHGFWTSAQYLQIKITPMMAAIARTIGPTIAMTGVAAWLAVFFKSGSASPSACC
jgi:NAD(P)-dependent dehydrogenase (short-subunit alcohol dehydrogenase family)